MNKGVRIWRCTACQAGLFPERLLCSRCHGHAFTEERVFDGVVEEISIIRHMIGQPDWKPRRIASVRAAGGVLMTVGLQDASGPGAAIDLYEEGNAPYGAAKGTAL